MKIDRTGQTFGKLFVLGLAGMIGKDRAVAVACECGMIKRIRQVSLASKTKPIRSCGCLSKSNGRYKTHNLSNHKFYSIWRAMLARCYSKKHETYKSHGAKGVTVCDEWRDNPIEFIKWLEDNDYKKGLELDRRDNNGNYSPENCRAVTKSENMRNRRDTIYVMFNGFNKRLIDLSEECGINRSTLRYRILDCGISPEEAVTYKRKSRVARV